MPLILVATDGAKQSDGALRVSVARAAAMQASLEMVTVSARERLDFPLEAMLRQETGAPEQDVQVAAVKDQIVRLFGPTHPHRVTLVEGSVADAIASLAIDRGADLLVVGQGQHKLADRLFRGETALQLVRMSRVPVLVVPADAVSATRHAVAAVDFSDMSDRIAQAAIASVSDGVVDLLHVMLPGSEYPFAVTGEQQYEVWARSQLDALVARLIIPNGVTVNRVTIRGHIGEVVLGYARRVNADLITSGTHGPNVMTRAVVGSVATALVRTAHTAVLFVPRSPLGALAPV